MRICQEYSPIDFGIDPDFAMMVISRRSSGAQMLSKTVDVSGDQSELNPKGEAA